MKTLCYLLLGTMLTQAACAKKDECPPVTKDIYPNQVGSLLSFAMFNIRKTGSGTYEYGNVFQPLINGKVTALRCLMPDRDNYRVTLWDSATQTVLASETITGSDTINGNAVSITPVAVKAGKTYLITIRSVNKRWFNLTYAAGGLIPYPLSNNYIKLTGYLWKSTGAVTEPEFPTNKDNTYIAGLADFSFQPD